MKTTPMKTQSKCSVAEIFGITKEDLAEMRSTETPKVSGFVGPKPDSKTEKFYASRKYEKFLDKYNRLFDEEEDRYERRVDHLVKKFERKKKRLLDEFLRK